MEVEDVVEKSASHQPSEVAPARIGAVSREEQTLSGQPLVESSENNAVTLSQANHQPSQSAPLRVGRTFDNDSPGTPGGQLEELAPGQAVAVNRQSKSEPAKAGAAPCGDEVVQGAPADQSRQVSPGKAQPHQGDPEGQLQQVASGQAQPQDGGAGKSDEDDFDSLWQDVFMHMRAEKEKQNIDWLHVAMSGPRYMATTFAMSLLVLAVALALTVPTTLLAETALKAIHSSRGGGHGIDVPTEQTEAALTSDEFTWVTLFMAVQWFTSGIAQIATRWAIIAWAWNCWDKAWGWPLVVTLLDIIYFVAVFTVLGALQTAGVIDIVTKFGIAVVATTPTNFLTVTFFYYYTKRTTSTKQIFCLAGLVTALDWVGATVLTTMLKTFYATEGFLPRILIRVFVPTLIRRLWMHLNFKLAAVFDVQHDKNRFLLLMIPISSSAAAGTYMQMGSSLSEASLSGAVMMVLEVMDSLTMLRGLTHVESWSNTMRWCLERRRASFAVAPEPPTGDAGKAEAKNRLQLLGMKSHKDNRHSLLATAAVYICIAEGVCLGVVTVQMLMLPINPNDVDGQAIDNMHTLHVFLISLAFEFGGDALTAWLSALLSQRFMKVTDASLGHRWAHLCSVPGLVAGVIIALAACDYAGLFLSSLCLSSQNGVSGQLPALGRCAT